MGMYMSETDKRKRQQERETENWHDCRRRVTEDLGGRSTINNVFQFAWFQSGSR